MKTRYEIGQWLEVDRDFERVFKVSISRFFDSQLTYNFQRVAIDPFVFDEYLHSMYGDYENAGKSMKDVIVEHYGEEGFDLFCLLM